MPNGVGGGECEIQDMGGWSDESGWVVMVLSWWAVRSFHVVGRVEL